MSGDVATALIEREPTSAADAAPSTGRTRPTIPFLPGIEGLRGLALLAVMLFHSDFSWAKGGFLGVSTFFTLSGFLITLLLLWEFSGSGTINLVGFWSRRYRRLMPAALLCLAGVVAFGYFVATPAELSTLRGDVLSAMFYVANWHFIATGQSYAQLFTAPSPVLHFWSLAIEEQFYLVFPIVMFLTFRIFKGSRLAVGVVLGIGSAASLAAMFLLYTPGQDPSRVYYGTGTRAIELLLGALLALALSHPSRFVTRIPGWAWSIAGMIGVVVTFGLWATTDQSASWLYQGGLAAYALMSCLFIVAAIRRGPVRKALSWRPLRWLGAISYGAYLFHWPIYLWLTPRRTGLDPWPLFALRFAVTIAVSALSAKLLERPVRQRRFPVRVNPALLSGACAGLIIVGLLAVTAVPSSDLISFSQSAAAPTPSAVTTTTVAPKPVVVKGVPTAPMPPKVALAPGQAPRVMLAGDSTMLTLGGGVVRWGAKTGQLQGWDAGTLGCPIGRGGAYKALGQVIQVYPWCDWTTSLPSEIAGIRPQVIGVMYGPWDVSDRLMPGDTTWRAVGDPVYDRWLRGQISDAIDDMTAQGATVVWLIEPYFRVGITSGSKRTYPEEDPARLDKFNQIVREVIATKPRAQVLDLAAHMKTLPEGEMSLKDRTDGMHWTDAAADAMAPWLGTSLIDIAEGKPPLPINSRG